VDTGWSHCLPTLKAQVKTCGLKLSDIRYVMLTHAHPDHAGLIQTLKQLCGAQLVIHENQIPFLMEMNAFFKRKPDADFEPVRVEKNDLVLKSPNRAALQSLGILGEMIETPGHSDDSVSLILDDRTAYVGDLTRPDLATEENAAALTASWKKILRPGINWIYPGHGDAFAAADIEKLLA
jgi:glyoxylase-like metal-dependent hydrolase (beta-lactamase superfamily II)